MEFMMSWLAAFIRTSLVKVTGSLRSSIRCALNSFSSSLLGSSPKSRRYETSSNPNLLFRNPFVRSLMSYPR